MNALTSQAIDARDLDREIVKRGTFYDFLEMAWPHVVPTPFVGGWHLEEMCAHLEAVSALEIRELVINVPPGMTKSLTTNVFWPAWNWLNDPTDSFMFASYDISLVRRDAGRTIELIQSEWFQERWPHVQFKDVNPGETEHETTKNGFRFSTSPGGKATGRHVLKQVCDDPNKPRDTSGTRGVTAKALEEVRTWWKETMSNRKQDAKRFSRVLIMQRLHDLDLAAMCIEAGYTHLKLPMRFDVKTACKTIVGGDRRTEQGELLCPDRYPEEEVKKLEDDLGPVGTAAQMQQDPAPKDGVIIKKANFRHYRVLPPLKKFRQIIQSWDLTFKGKTDSDIVEGDVWGVYPGCDVHPRGYYLLDNTSGRMGFTASCAAVEKLSKKWPLALAKYIEDKANGPALEDVLKVKLDGLILLDPQGSKSDRLWAVQPLFEAGNVFHPHPDIAPWIIEREKQLLRFPHAANDDGVDTTTQALRVLHLKSRLAAALGG